MSASCLLLLHTARVDNRKNVPIIPSAENTMEEAASHRERVKAPNNILISISKALIVRCKSRDIFPEKKTFVVETYDLMRKISVLASVTHMTSNIRANRELPPSLLSSAHNQLNFYQSSNVLKSLIKSRFYWRIFKRIFVRAFNKCFSYSNAIKSIRSAIQ